MKGTVLTVAMAMHTAKQKPSIFQTGKDEWDDNYRERETWADIVNTLAGALLDSGDIETVLGYKRFIAICNNGGQ